jgi:hypothetical protein
MDLIQILKQFDIGQLTLTCSSGIVGIVLIVIRKKLEKIINLALEYIAENLKKHFKKKYTLHGDEINRDTIIKEMLIELRTILKAERSYVYQFHNGNYFNTSNPMWKITNTHESVAIGVSSEMGHLHNILSSSVTDLISCFWNDQKLPRGVERVSTSTCRCNNTLYCKLPHGVFLYNVNELEEGFSKAFLAEQGSKYVLVSPLIDNENRIGFVGVDFTKEQEIEDITKYSMDLCKYATKISYLLVAKQFKE